MTKPISSKLRTLATLYALYKHSDSQHKMSTSMLNAHLQENNVQCASAHVLSDTVRVMREIGLDARSKGAYGKQGFWIEKRPLPDHELKKLIFAVSTNPYLSQAQATDILQSLKPLVTTYQEPFLRGQVETSKLVQSAQFDDSLYETYSVICEAITAERRIGYSVDYPRYNKENRSAPSKYERAALFTPKCIYQAGGELYMVGYDYTTCRVAAVNLKNISSIKLTNKRTDAKLKRVNAMLKDIAPQNIVPEESGEVIYKGPVSFRCHRQFVGDIFHRFGAPNEQVFKSARGKPIYSLANATVTAEDLFWLSQIRNHSIRIVGPKPFEQAVKKYCEHLSQTLLGAKL